MEIDQTLKSDIRKNQIAQYSVKYEYDKILVNQMQITLKLTLQKNNLLDSLTHDNQEEIQYCSVVSKSMTSSQTPPPPFEMNFVFWATLLFLNGPLQCLENKKCQRIIRIT